MATLRRGFKNLRLGSALTLTFSLMGNPAVAADMATPFIPVRPFLCGRQAPFLIQTLSIRSAFIHPATSLHGARAAITARALLNGSDRATINPVTAMRLLHSLRRVIRNMPPEAFLAPIPLRFNEWKRMARRDGIRLSRSELARQRTLFHQFSAAISLEAQQRLLPPDYDLVEEVTLRLQSWLQMHGFDTDVPEMEFLPEMTWPNLWKKTLLWLGLPSGVPGRLGHHAGLFLLMHSA